MQIGVFKGPNGFEYFAPANTDANNIEGQAILYQNEFLTLNGKNITLVVTQKQLLDGELLTIRNITLILIMLLLQFIYAL